MWRFISRSLFWYWRTNLMIVLAIAVSAAVIGGSLIVGDSMRASLREMTLSRLGGTSHVLSSPRFFSEELAQRLREQLKENQAETIIAPAIMVTGSVERKSTEDILHRATGVGLNGVPESAWPLLETAGVTAPGPDGIVLGSRTAEELKAQKGDVVTVWVELPSAVPRDSLLGEREDVSVEIELTVEGILGDTAGASRFSLHPAQQLPSTAFVSLATLQQRLKLEKRESSSRNPFAQPARVNSIWIGRSDRLNRQTLSTTAGLTSLLMSDTSESKTLNEALRKAIEPGDVGLRFRLVTNRGYLVVESEGMILEDSVAESIHQAASQLGLESTPNLVYLANELWARDRESPQSRFSMYSIVAGMDFASAEPLGPVKLNDDSPVPFLNENDIILSDWLAQDLQVRLGDIVSARWHEVGSHGDLPETQREFVVRGILKPDDRYTLDRDLTPFVDGVTNVKSFSDWDQPFEMEMNRITTRDDEWWEEYQATPKAFVSLGTAEKFWGSRFGKATSIRVASPGVVLPEDRLMLLESRLADEVKTLMEPMKLGLYVRPVRAEGLMASSGANDFTQLFVGFSFFLIVSAILLAGLMFQLNVRQRVAQIGLMEAVGFSAGRARRILTAEGLVLALIGSGLGCGLAVGFARLMIYGLTTWWVGATGTRFLLLDVQLRPLIATLVLTVLPSMLVIWNSVRRTTQRTPRELLAGLSSDDIPLRKNRIRSVLVSLSLVGLIAAGLAIPAAIVLQLIPMEEAFAGFSWKAVGFFAAGFCWLGAGLLLLNRMLIRRSGSEVNSRDIQSLSGLALANACRNPSRSLLTTCLIAFAAFVIVAAGAARRNPVSETPDRRTGNGGFRLVAESSSPVLFDLNSAEGRLRLGLDTNDVTRLPQSTQVYSFRTRPGDDASCLNLYQVSVPTLLGASHEFLERGGFRFADTPGENPWLQLEQPIAETVKLAGHPELPAIPVIGDMNTLQYSLKKKIGDAILFPNDSNPTHALVVSGALDSSVLQGVLVVSDANLKRLAPDLSGSRYFLIECDSEDDAQRTAEALETALQAYGVDTQPVSERLADFLAVQNTYLSTFQMLGGLGLLIGTLGLAAVMMRNITERRMEIALLRALGFRASRILWLIFSENTALLMWGLLTGALSALTAMLPHLLSTGADVPWMELGLTLGAVLVMGTAAALFPAWSALRVSVRDVATGS